MFRIILSVFVTFLSIALSLYLTASLILFVLGVAGNTLNYCKKEPVRIVKYFPVYKYGCYLGSKPSDKDYYYNVE